VARINLTAVLTEGTRPYLVLLFIADKHLGSIEAFGEIFPDQYLMAALHGPFLPQYLFHPDQWEGSGGCGHIEGDSL
jgi:hypothetical protein